MHPITFEEREAARTEARTRLRRLGTRIRTIREEAGINQADFGTLFEDDQSRPLPQTTVSRWERGLVTLNVEQIRRIEEVFKIPYGSLLASTGYTKSNVIPTDVETMLIQDPNLNADLRQDVVMFYRTMVGVSRKMRSRQAVSV